MVRSRPEISYALSDQGSIDVPAFPSSLSAISSPSLWGLQGSVIPFTDLNLPQFLQEFQSAAEQRTEPIHFSVYLFFL